MFLMMPFKKTVFVHQKMRIFVLFNFFFSSQEHRESFENFTYLQDGFKIEHRDTITTPSEDFKLRTSSLATPALAYHHVEHENVSNNIDPTLLSIIYIILFLLIYFILDFLLWIISLIW